MPIADSVAVWTRSWVGSLRTTGDMSADFSVHQAGPERDCGGLASARDAEFGEDVGDVDTGGLAADVELLGNAEVAAAGGDEAEHFYLTSREAKPLVFVGLVDGLTAERNASPPGQILGVVE